MVIVRVFFLYNIVKRQTDRNMPGLHKKSKIKRTKKKYKQRKSHNNISYYTVTIQLPLRGILCYGVDDAKINFY